MIGTKISELKAKLRGGVAPALATPVLADGMTVNTAVLPDLIDFLLDAGVSGLFVGGTTGEGVLLSEAERMRLHETAVNIRKPGRFSRQWFLPHPSINAQGVFSIALL